jgi:hypothetical protein
MLECNAQEMQLVQKRKARLIIFREKVLGWDAQDQKVTSEWEQSG